ncbi:MAG: hypothetical protein EA381_03730 [Planctomycetaceae bacterium]|nr:MAG: hypothetical protein EA381_03730 [Planctomycetaceae bacterium]
MNSLAGKSFRLGLLLTLATGFGGGFVEPWRSAGQEQSVAESSWLLAPEIGPLVRARRWGDAYRLAKERLEASPLAEDAGAKWAILMSMFAMEMRGAVTNRPPEAGGDDAGTFSPLEPVERLLAAYPDHPRAPWLRVQRRLVSIGLLKPSEQIVLSTPGDADLRLRLLAASLESARDLSELRSGVTAEIDRRRARREPTEGMEPWLILRDRIVVAEAELWLRRGDFFASGTTDFLAAAGRAERIAAEGLEMLPENHPNRIGLVLIRGEAWRRLGESERAAEWLTSTVDLEGPVSDATLALAIRIAIDRERLDEAGRLLAKLPLPDAGDTDETDLARLRYLVLTRPLPADDPASIDRPDAQSPPAPAPSPSRELIPEKRDGGQGDSRAIGDWIEAIGRRGGEVARRRAETLALEWLGPAIDQVTDERLLLAEAAWGLRAGQVQAVAERLDQAARESPRATAASALGIAGAAAWARAGREADAAELLAAVAGAWRGEPGSADLLLQAAVLAERAGDPASVERHLGQVLEIGGGSAADLRSRNWLAARRARAGELIEAARVATPGDATLSTADDRSRLLDAWVVAAGRWSDALMVEPWLATEQAYSQDAEAALEQKLAELVPNESPAMRLGRCWLLALWGSVDRLERVWQPSVLTDSVPAEVGLRWIIAQRLGLAASGEVEAGDLAGLPDRLRLAAIRRFVSDGLAAPERQSEMASAIRRLAEGLDAGLEVGLAVAQADVWHGDFDGARVALERWLAGRRPTELPVALASAAQLLAGSPETAHREQAVRYCEAAIARERPGSGRWHRLQLAAIGMLEQLGRDDEAARRAAFLLAAWPPDDEVLRAGYRRRTE